MLLLSTPLSLQLLCFHPSRWYRTLLLPPSNAVGSSLDTHRERPSGTQPTIGGKILRKSVEGFGTKHTRWGWSLGIPVGIHQPTKTVYSISLGDVHTTPKKGFQGVEGPHTHARVVRRPSVRVDRPSKTETVVCLFDSIKLARSYQHTHTRPSQGTNTSADNRKVFWTLFFCFMEFEGTRDDDDDDGLLRHRCTIPRWRTPIQLELVECVRSVRDTTPPHAHMNPPNLSRQRSRPPTQAQQQRHGWKFGR